MSLRGAAARRVLPLPALVVLLAGLLWSVATPANAHYVGVTSVVVSAAPGTERTALDLDVQVPLQNLDFAYGTHFDADPVGAVDRRSDWLRALVAHRVALVGADGTPWTVTIGSLAGAVASPENVLRVQLHAKAPAATPTNQVDLRWSLVTDIVYSDKAFVSGTSSSGSADLIGVLTHQQPTLRLPVLAAAGAARVRFGAMLLIGAHHFREGVDHQLFLCVLAIGAARRRTPLLARARRLALLTLCFTVGHSVSLALASLGVVTLPSRWVETCIAATIIAAAAYTLRPRLTQGAELVLTLAFGLVHGFGFAGTLKNMSLRGAELAQPLLAFNLGLELAQLAALAVLAVPIWLISRSRATTYAVTATITVVAATWIVQRAFDLANPVDGLVNAIFASPERLALVLLVVGLPHLRHRRSSPVEL